MKPSGSTARSRSAAAQSTTSMVCSNTPPSGWNAGFWGTEAHALQLRKEFLQVIHPPQLPEEHRRMLRLQKRLFHLLKDALGRNGFHIDFPAERQRPFLDLRVQPRGELSRPEHAQRVLGKGLFVHAADDPRLQIGLSAPVVDHLAGQHVAASWR